jgi:hypothetical protein
VVEAKMEVKVDGYNEKNYFDYYDFAEFHQFGRL